VADLIVWNCNILLSSDGENVFVDFVCKFDLLSYSV
jgi:hypothetical protein